MWNDQEFINIGDQDLEPISGTMNRRYLLTLPGPDGAPIPGIFTPDEVLEEKKNETERLLKIAENRNVKVREALENLLEKSESFRELDLVHTRFFPYREARHIFSARDFDHKYDRFLKEAGYSDAQLKELVTPEFTVEIDRFMTGYAREYKRHSSLSMNGLKIGDNLNRRAAAATVVAELLGAEDVLARSWMVRLKKGEEILSGVFMEMVYGSDFRIAGDGDPMLTVTEDTKLTPKVVLQNVDMMVLDIICGNPDRIALNIIYQFDTDEDGNPRICGIKGIDNDLAFVNVDFKFRQAARRLQYLSRNMAEHILDLSVERFVESLQGFSLTEEQIQKAAERLTILKDRLSGKTGERMLALGEELAELGDMMVRLLFSPDIVQQLGDTARKAKGSRDVDVLAERSREDDRRLSGLLQIVRENGCEPAVSSLERLAEARKSLGNLTEEERLEDPLPLSHKVTSSDLKELLIVYDNEIMELGRNLCLQDKDCLDRILKELEGQRNRLKDIAERLKKIDESGVLENDILVL